LLNRIAVFAAPFPNGLTFDGLEPAIIETQGNMAVIALGIRLGFINISCPSPFMGNAVRVGLEISVLSYSLFPRHEVGAG